MLAHESVMTRGVLTLLGVLGFPYLGHIGPWNGAASIYTVSVTWVIIWYSLYTKFRCADSVWKGAVLFCATFIAASWHEVWLIAFAFVAVYFLFDAVLSMRKNGGLVERSFFNVNLSIFLGCVMALAFYTRGGASKFLDERASTPGLFFSLLNWPHFFEAVLTGTKTLLVLIKDGTPVFLMILFVKLNRNFRNMLAQDFRLLLFIAFGAGIFLYINAFFQGAAHWRVRCLCLLCISAAVYAFEPGAGLVACLGSLRNDRFIRILRAGSFLVLAVWLSYNAYRTYIYTNINVAGWLQYRQMVLTHSSNALNVDSCQALPQGRPKGVAHWDHVWGAQDDRYRFFSAPTHEQVLMQVKAFWASQENKK